MKIQMSPQAAPCEAAPATLRKKRPTPDCRANCSRNCVTESLFTQYFSAFFYTFIEVISVYLWLSRTYVEVIVFSLLLSVCITDQGYHCTIMFSYLISRNVLDCSTSRTVQDLSRFIFQTVPWLDQPRLIQIECSRVGQVKYCMLLATHSLGIRPRARLIHEDDSH